MARQQPDPLARARDLQIRARTSMAVGKPRVAQQLLQAAHRLLAELPHDRERAEVLARVDITLANAEFELLGLAAARERLDAVARFIESEGLDELVIPLQNQRGLIAWRAGRLAEATEEFDRAMPFLASAPLNERCYILLNRANVHLDQQHLDAARRDLADCAATAAKAELPLLERMAKHNLGYAEFLSGNLADALRLMDEAVDIDTAGSPGLVLQGKAEVLVEAGLHREADEALAQAADIFRRDRLTRDLAVVELDRARCALAIGDAAAAQRLAAAARRRFRRRGDAEIRAAELVLLQAAVADGAPRRVAAAAQRLRAEFAKEGLDFHARAAGLIEVEALLRSGADAAARDALHALGAPQRRDPITGRMHWHFVSARAAAVAGDRRAAVRRVRQALDELARYQASFGSIDLRTASAVHGRRLAELDITLARQSGRPAALFAAAERARAVSTRLPTVRGPQDEVAAELLAELRQVLEALHAVEQDRAASAPLLRKRRQLERRIVERSWTVSGSGAVAGPASLDAVRAALRERGATMVTYVQAGGELSAVVVGERTARYDLGPAAPVIEHARRVRADLDVLAQPQLAPGIRGAVCASLDRSLAELDRALLAPLSVEGPLVLVSTGVLGQLPWAALRSVRGRSIVVAPSATKWLASTTPTPARSAEVVAVAGPGLGRGTEEVAAVARAWPRGRAQPGGTTSDLVAAMSTATVLHVAAHGVHQSENPLFSSLRLVDGPVFAHELDQRGHAPEHVVLSACEVGLATIRPGDEALGLASVLLNLGTRSVIASVARVGDAIAEQTMVAYHGKLASGRDSATALAEALDEVDSDVLPPFVTFGAAWTPGDLVGAGSLA